MACFWIGKFFIGKEISNAKCKAQSVKLKLKIQNFLFNFALCVAILHFSL